MELTIQQNSTAPLTQPFLRDGVAGNYEILYQMIRVIRESVKRDLGLKDLTAKLLIDNKLTSASDAIDQLAAIYKFVQKNVKYIQDQAGLIESIKDARTTLADGYGDCDDIADTIASMVGCIGFEDVRLAMTKYLPSDVSFVHIYPVVYINGERVPMDITIPNGEIGQEVQAIETKEISVFSDVQGLDGFSGLYNNTKYHAKQIGKTVIETVPMVADFLPLGFISSQAFATGARLINQSTSNELSINAVGSKINQALDRIIVDLIRSQTALDMAQAHALQVASQLSTIRNGRDNTELYKTVKESIQTRVGFIYNFEEFAKINDIPVVRLNAPAILAAGVAGVGFGAYVLFQIWRDKKSQTIF